MRMDGEFMKKHLVIAGCRDYNDYQEAKGFIDRMVKEIRKTNEIVVLSGGCRGADALGERYAKENGFEVRHFLPDWKKFGRAAGPRRNEQMAAAADYVICFWDGQSRGTKSMIDCAKRLGKPLRVKRVKI